MGGEKHVFPGDGVEFSIVDTESMAPVFFVTKTTGLAQGWRKAELPPIEAYLSPGTQSLVCGKVVLAVVFALLEDVLPCGSGAAPSLSFPSRCEGPSGHFPITCYV